MLRNEASRKNLRTVAMNEILRPRAQDDTFTMSRYFGLFVALEDVS